ncbi:hypothetical protein [Haloglomus salinum]|nr:hypothetical protein [Haloglomus salinum]
MTDAVAVLLGADCGRYGDTALGRRRDRDDRAVVRENCVAPALRLF